MIQYAHNRPPAGSAGSLPLLRPLPRPFARWPVLGALLVVLILAFTLRTYQLNYTDIEGDEAFSYNFSIMSLGDIINGTIVTGEPHPVGSYFMLHYWLELAGHNEFSMRFPSAWFGVLAVAVVYRLGRRLRLSLAHAQDAVPFVAAVLTAFSPFLIAESRDGRMYSMSLALTALSTWMAVELLSARTRPQDAARTGIRGLLVASFPRNATARSVAYVLVSWFALNVHYFVGTILVAQNVFVLVQTLFTPLREQKYRLVRWIIAELAILLAFAPWVLMVYAILRDYPGLSYRSSPLGWMLQIVAGTFVVGMRAPEVSAVFAIIAAIVLAFGTIRLTLAGQPQRWGVLLLVLLLVVPFTMAYLDSRDRATFAERQVIGMAVGFNLLAAAGMAPAGDTIRRFLERQNGAHLATATATQNVLRYGTQSVLPILLTLVMATGVTLGIRGYYLNQRNSGSAWRPLMTLVQRYSANVSPQQMRFAQNFPDPGIGFYYRGPSEQMTLPYRYGDLDGAMQVVRELVDNDVQRVILRMDVWNAWNGGKDMDIAQTALSTAFTKVHEMFTGRWTLAIYSRIDPGQLTPYEIGFSNGLVLDGATTRSLTEMSAHVPGKILEVHLGWNSTAARLVGTEKLFIHVLDQNGQVPAQLDVPLLPQDIQVAVKTYGVPITDTLPAGTYRVKIGIYDPGQPGAPRLQTSDNSDGVDIESLVVNP
ncbi:MAG: glycosyltransferase family 39 protein [Chloroflexi bacterium]|nr:glycosyltransferase family 39 protein [Chloroflexota bacterium]